MIKQRKIKKRPHVLIHLGLTPTGDKMFWRVPVSDAKVDVTLNGTLADALTGKPGVTIGCHLSNCATRNKNEFPHPVFYAVFTKTKAYIIDRWSKRTGSPSHCVRYSHNLGLFVDLNDKDGKKKLVKQHPEIVERTFVLHPPQKRPSQSNIEEGARKKNVTNDRRPVMPYGALRRAKEAGLIFVEL